MYHKHSVCRACGNRSLTPVFSLGVQPLANDFCRSEDKHAGFAPLDVLFCEECTLAQLSVVVEPEILYRNYKYVHNHSQAMLDHIETLWNDIATIGSTDYVFEIGSNDGTLLKEFLRLGSVKALGMDPAFEMATIAKEQNEIQTIASFFSYEKAITKRHMIGTPDVILARHVFCHIDDWRGFISALELVSKDSTLICIEAPYAGLTLDRCELDQVYHEHLSFLTVKAMAKLLKNTAFHVHSVKMYQIHGGSICITLRRNDSGIEPDKSVKEFIASENIDRERWLKFSKESIGQLGALHGLIEELALRQKMTIAGMGASAKSTVWINAAGIGKWISFIADETPQKQNRFSPGSDIPILPESALIERMPAATILFAWNWKEVIMAKHADYTAKGGHWIIPVPTVTMAT